MNEEEDSCHQFRSPQQEPAFSIDRLYTLSSHQHAILADITGALTSRRDMQENFTHHHDEEQ